MEGISTIQKEMSENSDSLKYVKQYLRQGKVGAVHLIGCECVTCTYNYPHKEHMIELVHFDRSMPYDANERALEVLLKMVEDKRREAIDFILKSRDGKSLNMDNIAAGYLCAMSEIRAQLQSRLSKAER